MAIKIRGAYGLIGGGAGALDAIDGAALVDKEIAIVVMPLGYTYVYTLDADSGAAESSPDIIAPDANPGNKRWILNGIVPADPTDGRGVGDRDYNDARYLQDLVDDDTPQLGGNLDLNEKAALFNEAPTSDHTFNGIIINDTVGEDVAIGDVLYLKNDGKWWQADADAEATTKGAIVMATDTILADADGVLLLMGFIRDDSWTWTVADELYVSCTPGNPTDTQPAGAGDVVRIVGWAMTATIVYFNPSATYVEIA